MTDIREIDRIVGAALDEDAPWGDLTSETLIPAEATATAELVGREPGVLSGIEVFAAAFRLVDARITIERLAADGDRFDARDVLARVHGPARGILTAERVALNLLQRMSGVATLTARYVDEVAGTDARIVDTRKTTPGLRSLERQAVRDGGGRNHRRSLSDAIMAKDNHLAVLTAGGQDLATALRHASGCRTPPTSRSRSTGSTRSTRCSRAGPARSCSTTSDSTTCAQAWRASRAAPSSRHPAASRSTPSAPSPRPAST